MSYGLLQRKPELPAAQAAKSEPTSLRIGAPDDAFEQEADRVANQVLTTAQPNRSLAATHQQIQRKCSCGGSAEGGCEECKKERTLQRKAKSAATSTFAPHMVDEVLCSPGQPLDPATRAFFEPRFGHDFSEVRIHTDSKAAESASSVNAHAFTVGRHVVFGNGRSSRAIHEGRALLAHELAHVLQQSGSAGAPTLRRRHEDDQPHPALVKERPANTELIEEAYPKDSLDEKQWRDLVKSARQKQGNDNDGATRDYLALYSDIVKIAGAPGGTINIAQGASPPHNVKPGLNFSLFGLDAEASTGRVDESGTFGVKLTYTSTDLKLGVAIILGKLAFNESKERTLAVLRHEMMHAEHEELALSSVARFLGDPKARAAKKAATPEGQFNAWLDEQSSHGLSKVDAALIRGANTPHEANTELLAHIEGFMTHFRLAHPAPTAENDLAFQELKGALNTGEVQPWSGSTKEVKSEALGRLQEYYCHSLDREHREAFEAWVKSQDRKWRTYNPINPGDSDLDPKARDLALESLGGGSKSAEAARIAQERHSMEQNEAPSFIHGLMAIIRAKCKTLGRVETPMAVPSPRGKS